MGAGLVPEDAQVAPQARGVLAVQVCDELAGQRHPHDAVAPAGGPHAQQLELQHGVRRVGWRVAPLPLVGGDHLAGLLVDHRDVEGAERDVDLPAGVGGARGVAVDAAHREHALPAAPADLPPRAREGGGRQLAQGGPVLLEQLGLGGAEAVVGLVAHVQAVREQAPVEGPGVVEARDRDEGVAPVAADLVLDVALLVARVGVGEGVVEPVVGGEQPEELAGAHLPAHPPADLRRVVEHRARGHAAHEREDAREPLAHALGGLAPEDLREAHVGVREAHREVVAARERAPHPEVRLAEVDLALAGEPVQLQEALGVPLVRLAGHLPAAPPHTYLCTVEYDPS